jgi:hypothetical protein
MHISSVSNTPTDGFQTKRNLKAILSLVHSSMLRGEIVPMGNAEITYKESLPQLLYRKTFQTLIDDK